MTDTIRQATDREHLDARARSYDFSHLEARSVRTAYVLRAAAEAYGPGDERYVRIEAGEPIVARRFSNAGFRGIECTVETADGRRIHGVSAGWLWWIS